MAIVPTTNASVAVPAASRVLHAVIPLATMPHLSSDCPIAVSDARMTPLTAPEVSEKLGVRVSERAPDEGIRRQRRTSVERPRVGA